MGYAFKKRESLPRGVRRIAKSELRKTAKAIRRVANGPDEDSVHEARQRIKKLRSLLRLVRAEIGTTTFDRENRSLQKIGRLLSKERDAQVQEALLGKIIRKEKLEELSPLRAALQRQYAAALTSSHKAGTAGEAERLLQSVNRRSGAWRLEDLDWLDLCQGYRRMYRNGKRALEVAKDSPRTTDWHEWRKRVKDLWHQSRLLRKLGPAGLKEIVSEAERVGEFLGEEHDLALLKATWQRRNVKLAAPARQRLGKVLACGQRRLRQCAVKLGRKLYAERPRDIEAWLIGSKAGGKKVCRFDG